MWCGDLNVKFSNVFAFMIDGVRRKRQNGIANSVHPILAASVSKCCL
ncbi:hypothetical protein RRSWK_04070 [Rhodopirellula sp. SWK7]|nr:hypothetical protein RRSWK_04070 [Rhodopirellula sp. SWK7]